MGTRSLAAWAALVVVALGLGARAAAADPKADIVQKSKEAMDQYDLMDNDGAKKLLGQALQMAKKAKLENDPAAANVYLDLGVVAFAGNDKDGAKNAFVAAVQIDAKVQIPPAYRQPELLKLLDKAREEVTGPATGPTAPVGPPGVDCATVTGLQHTILDNGKINATTSMEAFVGGDVAPTRVSIMYRPEGATEFIEARMSKQGGCKYTGSIPASGMKGSVVHYYVAAYDANNKLIAGKGSSGSPNIMELTAGAAGRGDEEDPINGKKKGTPGGGSGGAVSGGTVVAGKATKMYAGVAGGTGFGYVTGTTESGNTVENCCLGNSLLVITPEFGYYVNPQLSIGVAVRLGVPVGANVDGHATLAPGGVVRVRYALLPSGEGVRVIGQLGAGILRNTIKLNNVSNGMDTDIVAQGPLLLGGGVGYTKRISGNIAFVADLSALGAVAVVKTLGSAPSLNSGIAADLSLGVAVGF